MDASYNVHGTRSVQRLIQVCTEPDMVQDIMEALRGHIAALSSHSNGNHVIQRCLQHMPEEYRVYVFEEVVKSCVEVGDREDMLHRFQRIVMDVVWFNVVWIQLQRGIMICYWMRLWTIR